MGVKIVVSAEGRDLDAPLGMNFARSRYYLVVDVQTMLYEAVENPWFAASSRAGVQVAQMIAGQKPDAVVTGTIGPNAFAVLEAVGIPVFSALAGSVRSSVQAYRSAHLLPLAKPNAIPHAPFQHLAPTHTGIGKRRPALGRKGKSGGSQRALNNDELADARARARVLQEELDEVKARIREMESRAPHEPSRTRRRQPRS